MTARWLDRLYGAVTMYFVAGTIVTTSLLVHTPGPCPWWLAPYWNVTWLYQVVLAMMGKLA